jgi:hypothetical protein
VQVLETSILIVKYAACSWFSLLWVYRWGNLRTVFRLHILCGAHIKAYLNTIRKSQQYSLICTIPLFYVLDPTCFAGSLPSSGSILGPFELLEIQIELVVYHIMCGYVTCLPDCRGSVCCISSNSKDLRRSWWWQATAETCSSQYIE